VKSHGRWSPIRTSLRSSGGIDAARSLALIVCPFPSRLRFVFRSPTYPRGRPNRSVWPWMWLRISAQVKEQSIVKSPGLCRWPTPSINAPHKTVGLRNGSVRAWPTSSLRKRRTSRG
jgi:hypothetical protein